MCVTVHVSWETQHKTQHPNSSEFKENWRPNLSPTLLFFLLWFCEWLVSKWDSEQGQNKLGCHHGQPRCLPELGEIAPEVGLEASEKEAGQGNISHRNKPKIEEELWTLYFSWQASMCADSFSVFSVLFLPWGGIETNKMFSPNISTFQLYLLHLQQAWIFTKVFGALTSFYLS